ncbi:MAG: family 20 glycosylhydrolase [Saprospiraceae bacterium]|jgi:lysophospholipase L1-like esterase|nr:family 20 glycosylhydrolase [Saprospiraceae bacterium]MBP6565636.1 family 20 glycosylhydrolase [Saprospiraceae bacterium]
MRKNKKSIWFFFLILFSAFANAQSCKPSYSDSLFSTYYHQKVSLFKILPPTNGDIIFMGDSNTDTGEWGALFNDLKIKNLGISGDMTSGILNRLDDVFCSKPSKIFLLIGTNDLVRNISVDSILKNIFCISTLIKDKSPHTKLFVQSILPVNEKFGMFGGHTSKKREIIHINKILSASAAKYSYSYVDLYSDLVDSTGRLDVKYTNDGLHLTGPGYLKWQQVIYSKVYDLPALIPLPQKIRWSSEKYLLNDYTSIYINNSECQKEAESLKKFLAKKAINVQVKLKQDTKQKSIQLRIIGNLGLLNKDEAYHLSVTKYNIVIEAETAHGLYNGLQTLKQLTIGNEVSGCDIIDWPAFEWRGFMVDVGRNFQSIKQLKQQIDVMANYKLNIFHFHLTEDIAWRLQSKRYPQLTDAKYMTRNHGMFYSIAEMKELIAYCKERYITLIPEIDMPGHSNAFKKAMGVDMQSTEGMEICKNILTEFCKEFNLPYIHIGGDEVKITNKEFLPEMVSLLKSFGKNVIAWNPGGNVPEGTILQMWVGDAKPKDRYYSIDSRHLYLNHFDPFDGVTAVFNHQICDVSTGNKNKLGATLCNWPDRKVSKEEDLINMNAVYPVMLTFAERCWQGGGQKNYLSDIGLPGNGKYSAFVEFENRLLEHKSLYFHNLSFPYVKQSDIEWKLIGPFDNKGDTETIFEPELPVFFDTVGFTNYLSVYGGTIWLRHFWHPMIQSHLHNPTDSSTFYATRKIWSDDDGVKDFWIGFNNLSRSTTTDSPPIGKWDEKNSSIWVNGKSIVPPLWKSGGQKGNSEISLIDEGYEYRQATKIFLQQGWNTVLVKCPVGTFKGKDWQNPVKWMFTFVQLK